MIEAIVLGVVQGIAEWLPVSSEGILYLIKTTFFKSQDSFDLVIKEALFLHFGTFLAALIYFRKDVVRLLKSLFNFKTANLSDRKIIRFLLVSTLISVVFGFPILMSFKYLDLSSAWTAKIISLLVGILLLVTAALQIKASKAGYKNYQDITDSDSGLLGFMQGLAAIPGLSRSGLTVSALLLRKFDRVPSLKLSFLMSLPIVLGGNILFNLDKFNLDLYNLTSLFFSFLFGLLTIDILLKLARKVNFGYFILIFGVLTIVATFF